MLQSVNLRSVLTAAALGLLLGGCTPKAAPNITIENGSFRMPAPGQTTGAAYFDIVNTGGADVLVSASTPVSDHVELHIHLHENGVMKMRQVQSVDAAANDTTPFKRGGRHIMVYNVKVKPDAVSIPMTLNFTHSGAVKFDARIGSPAPMSGPMDHSKMNHGDMKHENTDPKPMEHNEHE